MPARGVDRVGMYRRSGMIISREQSLR